MDMIKIGAFYYKLEEVDHLARDSECFGSSCGNSLEIKIDNSISKDLKIATIIHEIIEQINFMHELDLEHRNITTLGNTLHQVLKENKELFKKYYE